MCKKKFQKQAKEVKGSFEGFLTFRISHIVSKCLYYKYNIQKKILTTSFFNEKVTL